MKKYILILLCLISLMGFSQRNELAWKKAKVAIRLMDEGKVDESIQLPKECEKIDNEDYTYPYEMAYAYILKKDYETAITILNKTKKYKNINDQVYQLSGNCYSYLNKPKLAIKEYEQGMKKFPNAGNLHLEKGNIFLIQEKYEDAIENYRNGIAAEPNFSSNYYRLALLYLNSTDRLSGLLYGEIFMNLERSTQRTTEMSKLLYDGYKKSIKFNDTNVATDFCEVILNIENKEFKMPFCAIFVKDFILGITTQKEINLNTLSEIRTNFIKNFFKDDYKNYSNIILDYNKKMLDEGILDTYNKYLFQIGSEEEFSIWKDDNIETYDTFLEWYSNPENYLKITDENKFIKL